MPLRIGIHRERDPAAEQRTLGQSLPRHELEASELVRAADQEVLRQLSVIENEPGCTVAGCHSRAVGTPVLGVLEVEMSMLPLDDALASARTQLIWTRIFWIELTRQ